MGQARRNKQKRDKLKAEFNEKVLKDYCTKSPDFNFSDCCKAHDEDYEIEKVSRWAADRKLRKCISKKGLGLYRYRVLPWVYWAGVRVFGANRYGKACRKKCTICEYLGGKMQKIKLFFL